MTRFAGLGKLGNLLKDAVIPAGKDTTERLINGAMMYGPDLAFAGFTGAMAPGGFNAGVGLEDLGISLAGTLGSGVVSRLAGQRFFPGNPEAQGRLQMASDLALTMPLQMFAPRPMLNAAIEKQAKSQAQQQELLGEHQEQKTTEQLLQALLTTGGLVNPGPLGVAANQLV